MTDIKTSSIPYPEPGLLPGYDYAIDGPALAGEDGLETAVIISLFTDRRAEADDVIPDGTGELRGWWGDSYPPITGDRIGSRLWLLSREKQLSSVLVRAKEYAEEALAWLVTDGIARRVLVAAFIPRTSVLGLDVTIERNRAAAQQYRFELFWRGN